MAERYDEKMESHQVNRDDQDVEQQADAVQDQRATEAAEDQLSQQAAGQPADQGQDNPLAALQRERDELHQRLLRISADYQNYVRRSQQNQITAQEQQLIDVARSLVGVLDHFDRALAVDPEKTNAGDLLAGMTIVRDEFMRALNRFGVQRVDAEVGEPFDPMKHEAMMRQPSEEIETDHVTQQLEPGYAINEKTVRPAKVSVAQ